MKDNNTTVVPVNVQTVSCQGHDTQTEHPLIYLQLPEDHPTVRCPYCGHIFMHPKKTA
ncbi:MAG: zinc-finger domain-containing protein [Candidatus Comchoanobacterales bacterium]